jgi:hypothetical protein
MLDALTQGFAVAILLALLATALILVLAAARAPLPPPGERSGDDLGEVLFCLLALLPAWLVADFAGPWWGAGGLATVALWPCAALAVPLVLAIWQLSGLGRRWRVMATDPALALAMGISLGLPRVAAILTGILLSMLAGLLLLARSETADLVTMLAVVAVPAVIRRDRLGAAIWLAVAVGLASGAVAWLLPGPASSAAVPAFFLLLLLGCQVHDRRPGPLHA